MSPSALELAFMDLAASAARLAEELRAASLTAADDQPRRPVALASALASRVVELCDQAELGKVAAGEAHQSMRRPPDLETARAALAKVQETVDQIGEGLSRELLSSASVSQLNLMAVERGREWASWANTLLDGLERSQQTLHETSRALARCWQELLERALVSTFSVQNHTVGQQIQVATPDFAREAT
jgi:hypothetical protein